MRPTPHLIDPLLGMRYIVLGLGLDVRVPEPREDAFIVVEEPVILPGSDYIYAVYKRGVSTPRMASTIARMLGVKPSCITVAGLKDTRATSVQYASISRACISKPPRLLKAGGILAILLGEGRLARGLVGGNRFTVKLCGPGSSAIYRLEGEKLRLPAYYGYQRFGTRRPNTHLVGLFMAWMREGLAASEALYEAYPDEKPRIALSRLLHMPRINPERSMALRVARLGAARLSGVAGHGLTQLYFSGLQALLFNEYLSLRMEEAGLEGALEGEEEREGVPHAPVPGVDAARRLRGRAGRLMEEAMAMHGLEPGDLESFRLYGVSARTFMRPVYMDVAVDAADAGGECVWLRFRLGKGMYASILLREVCKNIHKCVY